MLGALDDRERGNHAVLWDALLHFAKRELRSLIRISAPPQAFSPPPHLCACFFCCRVAVCPAGWEAVNLKKAILPKLWAVMQKCCSSLHWLSYAFLIPFLAAACCALQLWLRLGTRHVPITDAAAALHSGQGTPSLCVCSHLTLCAEALDALVLIALVVRVSQVYEAVGTPSEFFERSVH